MKAASGRRRPLLASNDAVVKHFTNQRIDFMHLHKQPPSVRTAIKPRFHSGKPFGSVVHSMRNREDR